MHKPRDDLRNSVCQMNLSLCIDKKEDWVWTANCLNTGTELPAGAQMLVQGV